MAKIVFGKITSDWIKAGRPFTRKKKRKGQKSKVDSSKARLLSALRKINGGDFIDFR